MNSLSLTFDRNQQLALMVGGAGLILALIFGFFGWRTFFQSYLYAYLFWLGASLGCFIILLAQHLAGGSWGATIRRPLEAGAMTLPVMALLFIPLLFGLGFLYEWTHADFVAAHPIVEAKKGYLNILFFIIRAVIYFALWIYGAIYFVGRGRRQDTGDGTETRRILSRYSAPWIIIYIITMTFAGVDWGMSLTPEWFSGIYSVTIMITQAITAMAIVIITMVTLGRFHEGINELLTNKRLQDLGNFLMAFMIFWAYVNFSQIIILWSNNVVETNTWYVLRFGPAWSSVGLFLLFFGFFGPFLILLSRWVKRTRRALALVAAWALIVQLINIFYIIVPSYARAGFPLKLMDVLLIAGLGGIWLWQYLGQLKSYPLLPERDPRIEPLLNPQAQSEVAHG